MFSQRNNPYCELLQNCEANIETNIETPKELTFFIYISYKKHPIPATKH